MDSQRHRLIRERIILMDLIHVKRREIAQKSATLPHFVNRNRELEAENADLPPLPPRLPRPEYALTANLVDADDEAQVRFYDACATGNLEQVASHVEQRAPSLAVVQFGMEQAAFAYQTAVADYLLSKYGTAILHSSVFERSAPSADPYKDLPYKDVCIFDGDHEAGQDPLPLVQVLVRNGWHPNQIWEPLLYDVPKVPLIYRKCLANKPLVTFLLDHGADPNIGFEPHRWDDLGKVPPDRRSGYVLELAVGFWDISLIDLLLAHGVKLENSCPLHKVARLKGKDAPFSQRRPVAEHLVATGASTVHDFRRVRGRFTYASWGSYGFTVFAYACCAQDWEFAEWLLDQGADPDQHNRMAFVPKWFGLQRNGTLKPQMVVDLVEKVKRKRQVEAGAREEI